MRDTLAVEGVCLDDICAGLQVLFVDKRNQVGLRDVEQVIVVLQKFLAVFELLA